MAMKAALSDANYACSELAAHLICLVKLGTFAAKGATKKDREEALRWFAVGWDKTFRSLEKLPVELFDDQRLPMLGRWSGRLRALLTNLIIPCADSQSAAEPLPEAWHRMVTELLPFTRDLVAVGCAPLSCALDPAAAEARVASESAVSANALTDWRDRAVVLLSERQFDSQRSLAEALGVNKGTVCRALQKQSSDTRDIAFQRAWHMQTGQLPRGFKTDSGDVDAIG